MEVAAPPFHQNVEDNQAVNKYQQVYLVSVALPHVSQELK